MDKLDAIAAFQRVVETGSFSAEAREKRVAQPTISKQIAALETRLGVQLPERSASSHEDPGFIEYLAEAFAKQRHFAK